MADAKTSFQPKTIIQMVPEGGSLLDAIAEKGGLGQTPQERFQGKEWVKVLADEVLKGQVKVDKNTEQMLAERISGIDELISAQLNEVMHAEEFQKLEASWRGLLYLVKNSETSGELKIKVLNVSKKDLLGDLKGAQDYDQSGIFKKVYEDEFGTLGGSPIAALIGDYQITRHPADIDLIERMSNVAAAAHAPFLTSADPSLLSMDSFTKLGQTPDLTSTFKLAAYDRWRTFRKSEDSRYVGLCLPHVLMRLPYGKDTDQVEEFNFEENVDGRDHGKYLWGNAAYALGARLTDAFAKHEWCAAIRGVEGGGLVEDLPTHTFSTDEGDIAVKCPTEIAITDRREAELSRLGFIPLSYYKGTNSAAFMAVQSANEPEVFFEADANASSRLSAKLQYTFAICRFAHFLKAMMRDKVGSFMSRGQCEKFLNQWISNYVLLDDDGTQDAKAKYPLREAEITVEEDPSKPGVYKAVARLRPHFQLDELTVSLRLVARLPKQRS